MGTVEAWDRLNFQVREHLKFAAPLQVRVFAGLRAATYEITQGLCQHLAHKKSVAFVQGQTFAFESLLMSFYKGAYQVQLKVWNEIQSPQDFISHLAKDTIFLVIAEDHPVTGELYPHVDEIEKLANEAKIFCIRISHYWHRYQKIQVPPYTIRLQAYSSQLCIAVVGEKFKAPGLVAPVMDWSFDKVEKDLEAAPLSLLSSGELREIEASLVGQPFFTSAATPRIHDRAVMCFSDISAGALIDILKVESGSLSTSSLLTTNLCTWDSLKTFQKWWLPAPSVDQLRGLVVIDSDLLLRKDFAKSLQIAYEKVLTLQAWT